VTTVSDDAVVLAPGHVLHAVDDENGFVETPAGVRRIRGRHLTALVRDVLPALDGTRTAAEVASAVPAGVREVLDGLRAEGLLVPAPAAGRTDGGAAGAPAFPDLVAAALGVPPSDDGYADPAEPVVLVTSSLFDPVVGARAREHVRRGQAHLVCGLDSGGRAFVGPVWAPDRPTACFDCLRLRLHTNHVHGRTRAAYQHHLDSTGGRPLDLTVPAPVALYLAGLAGWRARRHGADPAAGGRLVWIDTGELTATTHPLFAVPDCPGCDARCRLHSGPVSPVTDLAGAEDPLTGLVNRLTVRQADSGPRIYLSGSTSPDFGVLRPAMRVTNNGGAGFTRAAAALAALGESVERYAAGMYDRDALRLSSWADLGEEAVHPGRFAFYSAEQYADPALRFVPFTADTPVRWVRAVRYADGRPVWVPASQVYVPYRRARAETEVAPSISSGLAAGPTFAAAALSGLQEVLERDALAISWLHRLPPREVPDEAVRCSAAVSGHLAGRAGWTVRFHDLSLDVGVPVVAAVMDYRHGREQVLSFGSACRPDLTAAVEKAFLEAAQGQTYIRRLLRRYTDWEPRDDFADVDDFNKHAVLYTKRPELRERAGYLVHPTDPPAGGRPVRAYPGAAGADPATEFARLAAELTERGYPVYLVDLTTVDVAQAGVHVVRVLVPGLHHLAGVHPCRFLGGRRLHEIPRALGFGSRPDNPFPHPLP
jgi:bacteriocin biosynthesis cyclodehydratase domain-containing protein